MNNETARIAFWGTYDLGKPRVRLLLSGLRAVDVDVKECHREVWPGIEDKSRLGLLGWIVRGIRWIGVYPGLVFRYVRLPAHDVVVVPYMGQLDVLVLWLFARMRGVPIVWDVFLSLYDTVVCDRRLISARSPGAWFLYAWEWLACRAADRSFMDTQVHARYLERLFGLKSQTVGCIYVGAEQLFFEPPSKSSPPPSPGDSVFTVLFYGQFIPLHGIETIVRAAATVQDESTRFRWILIGRGQEAPRIDRLIGELGLSSIERVPWVSYEKLPAWIAAADVCLGIFGTTAKAQRVIPNKVYQVLAAGKPLITADTPAVRELVRPSECVCLVPPGDENALGEAVQTMSRLIDKEWRRSVTQPALDATGVGEQFRALLADCAGKHPNGGGCVDE